MVVKGRPQATKSLETTESIVKLAEESLEVGRLLGMKIIGKEEAALESIKISLKKEKCVQIKGQIDLPWH